MSSPVVVRPATVDDAAALGAVQVDTWQAAYRGIIPDLLLDGLAADASAEQWAHRLAAPDSEVRLLVATSTDTAEVIGYVGLGACRDADLADAGEVYALYVRPESWRSGVGRRLLDRATDELAGRYDEAVLWVLARYDPARRFYEACGWAEDGTGRVREVKGYSVVEVRYRRALHG
jgi:GNAT superfamily N-acetyltransferase